MSEAAQSVPTDLVSQALVAEVTKKVRELGLVVWVDAEGHYTSWVDRFAAQAGSPGAAVPYPIVPYRNSYLDGRPVPDCSVSE